MLDTVKVPIPCPQCGHEIEETIGRLKSNPKLTCRCGASIDVEADKLLRVVEKIEHELAKLRSGLR